MQKEPKSHPVSVRLAPKVKKAAERAASNDARSLSSLLQKILQDYLKASGYLRK